MSGAWTRGGGIPGVGPTLPPPLKAAVTRARSAWWLVRSRGRPDRGGIRILFYHRVSDDADPLAVSPRRFQEQMEWLAAQGYEVVDLAGAVALLERRVTPRGVVALNFDDGFLDVAENALPVLERLGFRATVFLPTGVIGGTASFAWYAEQPPLLRWDDVADLDGAGTLRFEAHTVTHPNLLLLDDDASRYEIAQSKHDLEARLARPVEAFCYPAGLFGERERAFVADAGYRAAVSCEPGVNIPGADLLALRRRQIDPRDRLLDFRAKVGGGHDTPLPLRGLYRRLRYGEGSTVHPAATALSTGR
ncbi:MAG TPA: polysaccharide deacetylase family protein [Gaiellaceae bacterium]|nr:polysaccharide deacetylase family protein [Gaiellaceae bacterium]